jgi:hypothetical protein
MTAEPARVAALQFEIARKYARRQHRLISLTSLRIADLRRLFLARYGRSLRDDDAGRADARIMAHHLARRSNAERRIVSWLELQAPWMKPVEVKGLIAEVFSRPHKWRADTLGKHLNLTDAERRRLGITTIGAVDVNRAERLARRREKARQRDQQRRRAQGAKPRAEYEGKSISRAKPWEAMGISRRTWYRLGKPIPGTSPCAA